MIHYSFDLRFNDVDVEFVLGSFCLGLGLGLEGCCLVNNTGQRPTKTRQMSTACSITPTMLYSVSFPVSAGSLNYSLRRRAH